MENQIFTVTKNEATGKLQFSTRYVNSSLPVSDVERRQYISYAQCLGASYCNGFQYIGPNNRNNVNPDAWERVQAARFNKTLSEISSEADVVAYSHCYVGWKTIKWQFNDDITFMIDTNFGYGSSSYFYLRVFYKGMQLTPYANLVEYRNARAWDIKRYTYDYRLQYSSWRSLMTDAMGFYNAVVESHEHKIFNWINEHLTKLVNKLNEMISSDRYYFGNECVNAEDMILVKAEKIVNSTEFLDNIAELPAVINPAMWLDKLSAVYEKYLEYADKTTFKYTSELASLETKVYELESDWRLRVADRLLKKFKNLDSYPSGLTCKKIRFLIGIRNRFFKSYSNAAALADIQALDKLWTERKNLISRIYRVKQILKALSESRGTAAKHTVEAISEKEVA